MISYSLRPTPVSPEADISNTISNSYKKQVDYPVEDSVASPLPNVPGNGGADSAAIEGARAVVQELIQSRNTSRGRGKEEEILDLRSIRASN